MSVRRRIAGGHAGGARHRDVTGTARAVVGCGESTDIGDPPGVPAAHWWSVDVQCRCGHRAGGIRARGGAPHWAHASSGICSERALPSTPGTVALDGARTGAPEIARDPRAAAFISSPNCCSSNRCSFRTGQPLARSRTTGGLSRVAGQSSPALTSPGCHGVHTARKHNAATGSRGAMSGRQTDQLHRGTAPNAASQPR